MPAAWKKKFCEGLKENGLRHRDAADALEVELGTLQRWMREEAYPTLPTIIAMSDLTGYSLDELFLETRNRKSTKRAKRARRSRRNGLTG